jgi:thiol-disulfide isomerase/thioredoxin
MKMHLCNKQVRRLIVLLVVICAVQINAQTVLRVGDEAPMIKYSKWVKGTPVDAFEKNKIYVVEFWATWCIPCKASIPHLTEMAHKYKDITFIGIGASEHPKEGETPEGLIEAFVKEIGDKMDYNICVDATDKFMANNWMKAAQQNGIPCAFIVDKDARIRWIGSPKEMEEPLAQIIERKFDERAYTDKRNAEIKRNANNTVLLKPIKDGYKIKDYVKIVAECEKLIERDSNNIALVDVYYVYALIMSNPEKAYKLAQELKANNSKRVRTFVISFNMPDLEKKFYDYAIEYLVSTLEKDANDFIAMYVLPQVYEKEGNAAKAIDAYEKLIVYGKANNSSIEEIKKWEDTITNLKVQK